MAEKLDFARAKKWIEMMEQVTDDNVADGTADKMEQKLACYWVQKKVTMRELRMVVGLEAK